MLSTRRRIVKIAVAFGGGGLLAHTLAAKATKVGTGPQAPLPNWRMPDESAPHTRTWMAFATSAEIWGRKLLGQVQGNQALIANTIAKYEPVSMLVRRKDAVRLNALLQALPARPHAVVPVLAELDDLWIRDTCCVFVKDHGNPTSVGAVDFNFNGWGEKQAFAKDAAVAAFVAKKTHARVLTTELVLEGGGIEVDGQGTAIVSESCVLNENRNPGLSKIDCEHLLKPLLGLDKIIWIPGIKGRDITDGHTDFYARFVGPGEVLAGFEPDASSYDHAVTLANIRALKAATDAHHKKLKVTVLAAPTTVRSTAKDFAAGYIGFYACNGAVIAQEFGDAAADLNARQRLQAAYPGRVIEQLNVDALASGGGSIHCSTQQEPR